MAKPGSRLLFATGRQKEGEDTEHQSALHATILKDSSEGAMGLLAVNSNR